MCIIIIIIDGSVTNPAEIICFSNCGSNVQDTDNFDDVTNNDFNECCNSVSRTSGYGDNIQSCLVACKFCYNDYISIHMYISCILT